MWAAGASDLRRDGSERWRVKLGRSRAALAHASMPRSEHELQLEAGPMGETR